ncbi:conserved exported hypothetical protein [Sulfurovum sp. enrichment culture clone C5]|uniref:Porin domain-containing protein n=1 Tax=Sulfurovum sp. enrichment culture clone C5 TaxID=497650 RepID=A0A0S4XPX4_9BACT|nr:conserved exported hypothetical protein [Sulfurovum sp. enrichment culture clone C5]
MKKTLLLSVVASGLLFAGGDIAPVEPAVVTPAPAPVVADSGWKFTGKAVVAYGTADVGAGDLFDQDSSWANAGVSLKAENTDVIGGLGLGVKLVGLGTLGLEEDVVSGVFQTADGNLNGGAITELYATYGIGNTSIKLGRQELPKALSPLAYSEDTFDSLFANTYGAALVVNTDLPNTVLVGAWVQTANSGANLGDFNKINGGNGVWMLTAQNKSIDGLTLTGSLYYGQDILGSTDNLVALWGDAAFNVAGLDAGLQVGSIDTGDNTVAFGAKIGGKADIISYGLAATDVNDEGLGVLNVGPILAGGPSTDNALYTTLENNVFYNNYDSTTYMAKIGADVLGGHLCLAGAYSDLGNAWGINDFTEVDLGYTTKVGAVDLTGMYVYSDNDTTDWNTLKVKAVYNF